MDKSELWEYIRTFYRGLLGVALLFAAALVSSFVGSFGGGAPDAAYGIEDAYTEDFVLPEEPVMTVYVWEKEETEKRNLVPLQARTPVNSGPAVAWENNYAYRSLRMPFAQDGLTISVVGEGTISARWEHEQGCDCGYRHTWWYSVDPDLTGGVDTMRLHRNYEGTAEGVNSLCILWRGEGGQPADTVTAEGDPVYDAVHRRVTLAQVLGEDEKGLNETVVQDSMTLLLHLECRNLLGRLIATATLRITMVSQWHGAGALYEAERPAVMAAEISGGDLTSRWIGYAAVKPTWTVELVGYSEG